MNAYQAFEQSVDRMVESPFIVANKRLTELLRDFTNVDEFTIYLKNTMASFNYPQEFDRASVPLEMVGSELRTKLLLPRQEQNRFAFVVCLLTEIDTGRRDFVLFLREFFNRQDTQEEYEAFCAEIILPFKELAESVYRKLGGKTVLKQKAVKEAFPTLSRENEIKRDDSADLSTQDISDIEASLLSIKSLKLRIDGKQKIELNNMIAALLFALREQNPYFICSAYTGLKYTMRAMKISDSVIKSVGEKLKNKGLLEKEWNLH